MYFSVNFYYQLDSLNWIYKIYLDFLTNCFYLSEINNLSKFLDNCIDIIKLC